MSRLSPPTFETICGRNVRAFNAKRYLSDDHETLALCLGFKEGYKGKRFVNLLKGKSIAMNELNGRVYSYNEVVDAIVRGFGDVFKLVPEGSNQGIQFKISSLSEYELELTKKHCKSEIISL